MDASAKARNAATRQLMSRVARCLSNEEREVADIEQAVGAATQDVHRALCLLAKHGVAVYQTVMEGLMVRWLWRLATPEESETAAFRKAKAQEEALSKRAEKEAAMLAVMGTTPVAPLQAFRLVRAATPSIRWTMVSARAALRRLEQKDKLRKTQDGSYVLPKKGGYDTPYYDESRVTKVAPMGERVLVHAECTDREFEKKREAKKQAA
jgi:hypothetical protein